MKRKVSVSYNSGEVTLDALKEAITDAGYDIEA